MYIVEITRKNGIFDPEAKDALHGILDLKIQADDVKVSQVYIISGKIKTTEAKAIAEKVLLDPIIENFKVSAYTPEENIPYPSQEKGSWEILKLFQQGVTDNVGETTLSMIHNLKFKNVDTVHTGKKFIIRNGTSGLTYSDAEKAGLRVLANTIIETINIRKIK